MSIKTWNPANIARLSGQLKVASIEGSISPGDPVYLLDNVANPYTGGLESSVTLGVCISVTGSVGTFTVIDGSLIEYGPGVFSQGEVVVALPSGGLGNPSDLTAGVNQVQGFHLADTTGGTFTLSFDGATTGAIPYNATASQMQSFLEALSTVGPNNVACTDGPVNVEAVNVEFIGGLGAQDLPLITSDISGATGPNPNMSGGFTAGVDGEFLVVMGFAVTDHSLYLRARWTNIRKAA